MDHGNPQPSQITLIRYYCAVFDNVRRVFGHLIVYGSADVAILVINVLLVPVYTRVLTPDEFGVLALLLLLEAFLRPFTHVSYTHLRAHETYRNKRFRSML